MWFPVALFVHIYVGIYIHISDAIKIVHYVTAMLVLSSLCFDIVPTKRGDLQSKRESVHSLVLFLVTSPRSHSHTLTHIYKSIYYLHSITYYIYNIYNAWMNVSCLSARYIYIYLPVHTLYTEWQYDMRYAHTVAKWYNMEMHIDMLCSMLRYDDKIIYYNMLSCVCVCASLLLWCLGTSNKHTPCESQPSARSSSPLYIINHHIR